MLYKHHVKLESANWFTLFHTASIRDPNVQVRGLKQKRCQVGSSREKKEWNSLTIFCEDIPLLRPEIHRPKIYGRYLESIGS